MRMIPAAVLAAMLAAATPASGHHSASIYDTDSLMTLEGTVTRYEWKNPHTYLQIETTDAEGTHLTNIEAGSISWLGALGLARDSFKIGDRLTVNVYPPTRPNSAVVLGREVITPDGTIVPLNSLSPYIERKTSTGKAADLSGTWVMENGATDRMHELQRSWKLTDAGKTALAEYDGVATPGSVAS